MNSREVLEFYAQWCVPCHRMRPVLERIKQQVEIQEVDVEENPQLAHQYGIMSVPTLVVLEAGQEVDRLVGAHTYEEVWNWLIQNQIVEG